MKYFQKVKKFEIINRKKYLPLSHQKLKTILYNEENSMKFFKHIFFFQVVNLFLS